MFSTPEFWYKDFSITAQLLRPLSWCYKAISALRRLAYQKSIFKSVKAPIPVIIVGNITAGGTGKTPLVIALVQALQQCKPIKEVKPKTILHTRGKYW